MIIKDNWKFGRCMYQFYFFLVMFQIRDCDAREHILHLTIKTNSLVDVINSEQKSANRLYYIIKTDEILNM